jgi:hypothetical protein
MTNERIDRLSDTPKAVAYLVADASDERLDRQPAPGEWSARTIMAHLRDDEYLCMRVCLERALAEEDPQVLLVDGADWVGNRNRGRDRKELIAADFALQRQASAAILRSLRGEDWERPMHHAQYGHFTISQFLDSWLQHDAEHIAELEKLLGETLAEVRTRRTPPSGV